MHAKHVCSRGSDGIPPRIILKSLATQTGVGCKAKAKRVPSTSQVDK